MRCDELHRGGEWVHKSRGKARGRDIGRGRGRNIGRDIGRGRDISRGRDRARDKRGNIRVHCGVEKELE